MIKKNIKQKQRFCIIQVSKEVIEAGNIKKPILDPGTSFIVIKLLASASNVKDLTYNDYFLR